jgi:hypothetical protein
MFLHSITEQVYAPSWFSGMRNQDCLTFKSILQFPSLQSTNLGILLMTFCKKFPMQTVFRSNNYLYSTTKHLTTERTTKIYYRLSTNPSPIIILPSHNVIGRLCKQFEKLVLIHILCIFYYFYSNQQTHYWYHKSIHHNSVCLYNLYSYMFRHVTVIIREFHICTLPLHIFCNLWMYVT